MSLKWFWCVTCPRKITRIALFLSTCEKMNLTFKESKYSLSLKKVLWLIKEIYLVTLSLCVYGRVFFLFWGWKLLACLLISVTRLSKTKPTTLLPVKGKYQVDWASLFPQPNITHLDTLRTLKLIVQTLYGMKHTQSTPVVNNHIPTSIAPLILQFHQT